MAVSVTMTMVVVTVMFSPVPWGLATVSSTAGGTLRASIDRCGSDSGRSRGVSPRLWGMSMPVADRGADRGPQACADRSTDHGAGGPTRLLPDDRTAGRADCTANQSACPRISGMGRAERGDGQGQRQGGANAVQKNA